MMQSATLKNQKVFFGVLLCLLPLVIIASTAIGAYPIDLGAVFSSYFQSGEANSLQNHYVFWQLRLPRVLLASIVGAALAISGTGLQGIFRNPLVDPGLIGVSPGAALAAALCIVFGAPLVQFFDTEWQRLIFLPFAAFIGGLVTTMIVVKIATLEHKTDIGLMLLAGVAMNAICFSGIGVLIYLANDDQLRDITFWSLGSLAPASWPTVALVGTLTILSIAILVRNARKVNQLLLGEAAAEHLGVRVDRCKLEIIFAAAIAVGAAVAICGMIGFVGLILPHIVRLLIGTDHRSTFWGSALAGAIFLPAADTIARTLVSPAELPIGIVTSAIGAPFFLWLLLEQRQRILT